MVPTSGRHRLVADITRFALRPRARSITCVDKYTVSIVSVLARRLHRRRQKVSCEALKKKF